MRRSRSSQVVLLALTGALVAGCGQAHQDAKEPKASFDVRILKASFPTKQAISHQSRLRMSIRNTGTRTLPNLSITIESFVYRSDYPNLSDRNRPVWIVDQGPGMIPKKPVQTVLSSPGNNVTATTTTWAAGSVAPGQSRTFQWKVTPVKAGSYTVRYKVAAGLNGKAVAIANGLAHPSGQFVVHVAPVPEITHVDPETGQIARGPLPLG